MQDFSFVSLLIVTAVAFTVPLVLGLFPRLLIPGAVLEILAGIAIGPQVLGWAREDTPIDILSTIGLAFLLFLGGVEIDLHRMRGRTGKVALLAFAVSVALAGGVGLALAAAGLVETPLIVGVMLVATSLGLVLPVVKDAGQMHTDLGQLAIAGGSIAEFGAIVLLSLLFSNQAEAPETKILIFAGLGLLAVVVAVVLGRAERSMRISGVLRRLQDTTAQIRIRLAMVLMLGFVALVEGFGQEAILGSFIAGVVLRVVDPEVMREESHARIKLDAIGYGFLVPVFFVASGLHFDLDALLHGGAISHVPVFLIALLVVRGLPAVLYRPLVGTRRAVAAGLLQATSLPVIVAAAEIAVSLGRLASATASAMIAAGLVSCLAYPVLALLVMRRAPRGEPELQAPE